jgi:hypothetical protein
VAGSTTHGRFARLLAAAAGILVTLAVARPARAQFMFENLYPGFDTIQRPGRFDIIGFGGGFISDKYATTQQGVQFEQSITPYIGAVGRVTGYQLWIGSGFDNPLDPGTGHFPRLNFARFQGGADFGIYPGTHLFVLGGKDVGDSSATSIEGDLTSWWCLHSLHPVNFSFSTIYNWENGISSNSIDVQAIVKSTEHWMFLAGVGGAFYVGGFLSNSQSLVVGNISPRVNPSSSSGSSVGPQGQGGPDLGIYYRPWQLGVSAQAGYGNAHQYGQISIYKQLSFFE